MIDKEKAKLDPRKQWAKFIVVLVLYLLFLFWVKSWLGLVVVPFIFDVYITKKIQWQWWRDAEPVGRFIGSWVDALVFALVAVYSRTMSYPHHRSKSRCSQATTSSCRR